MKQRLIDANHLLANSIRIEGNINLQSGKVQHFESIPVAAIEAAETIDAVEVVRCSECKNKHLRGGKWFCEVHGILHNTDGFCSEGEPIDNERGARRNAGDL